MSAIRHDSPDAERLALFWHRLAVVISVASVVVSLAGVGWHLWACKCHEEALEELEHGTCC